MSWDWGRFLGLPSVQQSQDENLPCFCDRACGAMGANFCQHRYDEAWRDLIDSRDVGISHGARYLPIEQVKGRADHRGMPIVRVAGQRRVL